MMQTSVDPFWVNVFLFLYYLILLFSLSVIKKEHSKDSQKVFRVGIIKKIILQTGKESNIAAATIHFFSAIHKNPASSLMYNV